MKKSVLLMMLAGIIGFSPSILRATDVSGVISSNTVWTSAGNPYVVQANVTISSGVTLTVGSGVEVLFTSGTSMYVYGTMNATNATFTAFEEGTRGYWRTIQVGSGSYTGTASFDNCRIKYGGYTSHPSYNASVYVYRGTASFTNGSEVINSRNHGIMLHTYGSLSLESTTISANDWPICYYGAGEVEFLEGNTLTGNTHDAVLMAVHSQAQDVYLDTVEIPYVFKFSYTVNNGTTLEIASGNILKLTSDLVISGTLMAVAGSGENIWFSSVKDDNLGGDTNDDGTATFPAPRSWGAIRFKSTSSNASTMTRCIVSFGGSGSISGVSRMICAIDSRNMPVKIRMSAIIISSTN